ncbi:MAG: hypothetical protein MRJ67_11735 [Nitrospirales bacterium]|nr:hypothetical protein [Nitrospirales bacterium]
MVQVDWAIVSSPIDHFFGIVCNSIQRIQSQSLGGAFNPEEESLILIHRFKAP